MEKISSGQTFYMKRIFPILWFGFLVFFLLTAALGSGLKEPAFLLVPLIMAVFGFFLFRRLIWDLADEVHDGGDFLLVRRGSIEERVRLSDVMNVSLSQFTNPKRLTLRLREPDSLGDEIVFIPRSQFQFNPFARNEIAERLMVRVDQLRNPGKH